MAYWLLPICLCLLPRRLLHPTTRQGPKLPDKAPNYQTKPQNTRQSSKILGKALKNLDKDPTYLARLLNY